MGLLDRFGNKRFNEGLQKARSTKGSVLLDVRTKEEFKEGHIPGSVNIPLDKLANAQFEQNAAIFVYCQSGARSNRASDYLKSHGLEVTNLGGIKAYKGAIEK